MDNDQQLTKEERKQKELEERQRQNEMDRLNIIRQKKYRNIKKWLLAIVILVALIALVWVLIPESEPLGEDFSQEIPLEGAEHLTEGTPVVYQSNPPTSGDHWPEALADGLYDTEKPDEAVVHSLEHGRIWISYKPSTVSQDTIQKLESFLRGKGAIILTPREAGDTDIALAAWMRLDTFDLPNGELTEEHQKRIDDFISRYRHKGPEYIPDVAPGKTYSN